MKAIILEITILITMASCSNLGRPVKDSSPHRTNQVDSDLGDSMDLGYAKKIADISYHSYPVSQPRFNKLDVYFQNQTERKPVVIYVHGGGWAGPDVIDGDKENLQKNEKFPKSLIENGFVIASINRRGLNLQLNGPTGNVERTTYEDQAVDVARAVKWVSLNAERFGGDSSRIVLLGFSSGAHLVTLTTNNTKFLKEQDVNLSTIKAVVAMDFHAYDIPLAIRLMVGTPLEKEITPLKVIFGKTEADQKKASPSEYINSSTPPPTLFISAGLKDARPQNVSNFGSAAFKDKFLSFKRRAQHHHFETKDHTDLILDYGTQKDDGISSAVISFLTEQLAPTDPRAVESIPENLKSKISNIVLPMVDPTGSDTTLSPGLVVGIVSPKYSEVLGFGIKKLGESVTPDGDTFYAIGSVSKIFTGLILAQEVVSKRMDPKKNLVSYLKDPIKSAFSPTVTLEQVVSHTSGLPSFPENTIAFRDEDGDGIGDAIIWSPARNYERKHLLACLRGNACRPDPATIGTYVYSNLGIGLLSMALEDHFGASSFDMLLKINFSRSLGMDDTGTNTPSFIGNTTARKAQGYRVLATEPAPPLFEPVPFSDMGSLAGSGEIISTANDMNKLLEHLLGLRESHLKDAIGLATTPLSSIEPDHSIGYAIDIKQDETGTTFYYKEGATASSRTYITWRKDLNIGVIVMSNAGAAKVKPMAIDIIKAIANPN